MLHRTVKKNDVNKDKWIGVGGHFEEDESPEECLLREVKEAGGKVLVWRTDHIQAYPEDKRAKERKVQYLHGNRSGKYGRYMEEKMLYLPVEVSVATEVVATAKAEKSSTAIVAQECEWRTKL